MRARARRLCCATIPMALIVLLVTLPTTLAGNGRDFSGFYELSNVTDLADGVSVTLTLELHNYSDADLYDVTLTGLTSIEPDAGLNTWTSPFIGSGESVRLSGELSLTQEEYERWQQGIPPMPQIEFSDAAGNQATNFVELALMHLREEG